MRKHIAIILSALIVWILTSACSEQGTTEPAALPIIPAPVATSTTNAAVSPMDGHWHQTQNGISDTVMTAEITGNVIKIGLRFRGVEDLYWLGSFDPTDATLKHQTTSTADAELTNSLFASHDATKMFKYENGELSYQFTMLGKTTTVHLARGE